MRNFTTFLIPVSSSDCLRIAIKTTPPGATRLRHALKPDEEFGLILDVDSVVLETRALQRRAWQVRGRRIDESYEEQVMGVWEFKSEVKGDRARSTK
jgi:hypothetical protein